MIALVDYDNVESSIKSLGPSHVARALAALLLRANPALTRIDFRYYGGWYEGSRPSRAAQSLTVEIQREFPMPYTSVQTGARCMLNAELAYALVSDPTNHLLHTFRKRNPQEGGIRCENPSSHGCSSGATCGLRHLPALLRNGTCPESACAVLSESILFKHEQKLVDVMLSCDLLHLAVQQPALELAIATSDHDVWPAIKQSLALNSKIFHVQTKRHRTTPAFYRSGASPTYVELTL